jgi:hypothetical protein
MILSAVFVIPCPACHVERSRDISCMVTNSKRFLDFARMTEQIAAYASVRARENQSVATNS